MDVQLTWTDCDKAGDYVVPNVLSPRDLVARPDNMDETVLHTFLVLRIDLIHALPKKIQDILLKSFILNQDKASLHQPI